MNSNCWYFGKCSSTEECSENCLRYKNVKLLIDNSNIPLDLHKQTKLVAEQCDLEAFRNLETIRKNIDTFVNEGRNLYLYSAITGNGKTTWSIRLLLSYFNKVWAYSQIKCRGLYLYAPSLMNMFKTQFLNSTSLADYVKKIKEADLIILDDLGCGKLTDYDINNLLDIIDYRLSNKKSMIFTSNLTEQRLRELFGDRLQSRIFNSSIVIKLNGKDKRGELL